jgi:WD40 repeat protein
MNVPIKMLPGAPTSDKSFEAIQEGLDNLIKSVCRLREQNDELERLRDLSIIHIQQYDSDIERLRHMYQSMKMRLDEMTREAVADPVPARSATPVQPPRDLNCLAHIDIHWTVIGADPFYNSSTIKLRYALHMEAILCTIRFNRDGSLFTFTDGTTVFLISSADGSLVGNCELPRSRNAIDAHPRAIAFSPDSKHVAVSGPTHGITIVEVSPTRVVKTLDAHTNTVSSLAFFKDSQCLLSGGFDGKLCVWNLRDLTLLRTIQRGVEGETTKDDMIVAIAMGADDEFICVGFMNGVVGMFDPAFSQPMTQFTAHQELLLDVAVSAAGMIATASHDKTAKLWALRGVASCKSILKGHQDFVLAVAFAPNDQVVLTGSKDETIKGWHTKTGQLLFTLTGHKNTLFQIDHHPTTRTFVSCSGEGLVCLWDYSIPPT